MIDYLMAILLGVVISIIAIVVIVGPIFAWMWVSDRREERRQNQAIVNYLDYLLEDIQHKQYITSWTHEEIAPGLFHPVRPDNYRGVR